jgi:hypothetical protein
VLIRAGALLALGSLHQYHYAAVVCLMIILASGGVMSSITVNAVMVAVGNRSRRLDQIQSLLVFVPAVLSILYTARLGGFVTQQRWSYHRVFATASLLTLL